MAKGKAIMDSKNLDPDCLIIYIHTYFRAGWTVMVLVLIRLRPLARPSQRGLGQLTASLFAL